MNQDKFGRTVVDENDMCDLIYQNPNLDISNFYFSNPNQFNHSVKELHLDIHQFPYLKKYTDLKDYDIEEFDRLQQKNWHMPDEYKNLDIAKHILDLCNSQEELQRVGQELLLFQERKLFDLLRWLKFFVDTMRANNLVWGLGRGSSVASYVLYLLGVHKINSMYYDLSIEEFLK